MKRTPLVLGGTVAGLVGVLMFRTTPSSTSFTTLPGASAAPGTSAAPAASASAKAASAKAASAKAGSAKKSGPKAAGPKAPSTQASAAKPFAAKPSATKATGAAPKATASASPASSIRTATGAAVNYSWGVLSVRVTVSGKKITSVAIAALDDGGNPRSQSIDQQSIPTLEQEALQAQSASIQAVSGASYTSAGFVQSLQSALNTLGV